MVTIERIGMSLREFMERFDREGAFEINSGEIVTMGITKHFIHHMISNTLAERINLHTKANQLGRALVETVFITKPAHDPNWVQGSKIPDVLFIDAARFVAYQKAQPDWETQPLSIVPDLVAEVISEHDQYADVMDKIDEYLIMGVRMILLVEPKRRAVTMHMPNQKQAIKLSISDEIDLSTVIADLRIPVQALFE
jgi:Uma2 family endonuclease